MKGTPARDYPPVDQGRMGPFATDRFTHRDLQVIRQLADWQALRSLDRCYQVSSRGSIGGYEPQLPRKLLLTGRGAGDGHLLHLEIENDVEEGIADGRIWKTELRLRLTEYEPNLSRIRCEANGQRIDLCGAAKLRDSEGDAWLVVDNPPLRQGDNAVLVVLEGAEGPNEWVLKMPAVNDGGPSLEQCELAVRCERLEDEWGHGYDRSAKRRRCGWRWRSSAVLRRRPAGGRSKGVQTASQLRCRDPPRGRQALCPVRQ